MTSNIARRALLALTLYTASAQPVWAAGTCKAGFIAKFPVTMEGPRATVAVKINGKDMRLWFDSGAFFNFMSKSKAIELGLTTEPLQQGAYVTGIGGSYTPELAKVHDFDIVGAKFHNMEFVVGGTDAGNGFLGANFLGIRDTEFDLAKGAINLLSESGCGHTSLAYWADGMSVNEARLLTPDSDHDHHIYVEVLINGHPLRAVLDSGAPDTIVYRRAALRAGIDLTSPKVVASMKIGGIGSHTRQSWIARTQTIAIGGEVIQNSPIRVIDDGGMGTDDMLLGVDFLISHHVLVSQVQRKLYLTYNGGPIFSVSMDGEINHLETVAKDMGGQEKATDPKTADEFAGRGSGRLTRGDTTGAISDFSEAIRLAPTREDFLAARVTAYFRGNQPALAARDIDAALVLNPADYSLLIRRAQYRLARKDRSGALADTEAATAATAKGSLSLVAIVRLYDQLGKADQALALLDPVLALHRDDSAYGEVLDLRSWTHALANVDLDRALKDCDATLRKAGANPSMLNTRALVQLRRKAYALAIADASAALAQAPRNTYALFLRGLARVASGDESGANADFATARDIRPAIDAVFAPYGLVAPRMAKTVTTPQPRDDNETGQ